MRFTLARPSIILVALVGSLPFAGGGGCGSRTACFQFTQAEFDLASSCPAPKDALAGFTDSHCPGAIVAVDGPGSFDGQICCYPVTYDDITPDCGYSGTGATGTGAFPEDTTGSGVVTTTCTPTCAFSIQTDDSPPCVSQVSLDAWSQIQSCACSANMCGGACSSLCQGLGVDQVCTSCM